VTAGFAASYAALCAAQGATVALPRARRFARLASLRSGAWALLPFASIAVTVLAIRAAAGVADGLTYLALVAVPPLAAVALGWVARGARPWLALAALPLLALAAVARHSLVGEAAAVALEALSCVTLAALIAAITPVRWLQAGLLAMAAGDAILVFSDLLQRPNATLVAAAPGGGLPQLQRAELGSAVMGYGDLFAAALLGAIVAADRAGQRLAALLTTAFALAFGTLFLVVDELPATVPVAAAMLATLSVRARRPARA